MYLTQACKRKHECAYLRKQEHIRITSFDCLTNLFKTHGRCLTINIQTRITTKSILSIDNTNTNYVIYDVIQSFKKDCQLCHYDDIYVIITIIRLSCYH